MRIFRRLGIADPEEAGSLEKLLRGMYDAKVMLPRQAHRLPLRDILSDALAQNTFPGVICTYQVRGTQIVIIPSYEPPVKPGVDPLQDNIQVGLTDEREPFLTAKMTSAQIYGGVVSLSVNKKPLADLRADLRSRPAPILCSIRAWMG